MYYFLSGLGPGGLTVKFSSFDVDSTCIPGSSHGGTTSFVDLFLYLGGAYDTQNITSLLGGSGGEVMSFITCDCFFFVYIKVVLSLKEINS